MHDQDPALYGALMYEICVEASQEGSVDVDILKMLTQEERKVVYPFFPRMWRLVNAHISVGMQIRPTDFSSSSVGYLKPAGPRSVSLIRCFSGGWNIFQQ
jgi:hypothetical protein